MQAEYNKSRIKFVVTVFLILYCLFILWRMLIYAYGTYIRVEAKNIEYNLIPFKTIYMFFSNTKAISLNALLYNLAGNIAVFMPIGYMLSLLLDKSRVIIFIASCLTFILFAETMQLITRRGVFDVDDIILNLIGCFTGYYAYKAYKKISEAYR